MQHFTFPGSFAIAIICSTTLFFSCKSSFPPSGSSISCNGQMIKPILNPTVRPTFPGESQAMNLYIFENTRIPQNITVKGKVRVAFVVTKEGDICDVRITSKPKEYIDQELIRVFKSMPKWNPGSHEGEVVDSYYLIDIKF